MKDNSLATFLSGTLMGFGICLVIVVSPIVGEYKQYKADAVSAGVARFNPQTSKFEFIQRQWSADNSVGIKNPKKSPIPGEKNLTQVEDLL
tara:strand:- start:26332 stop:26604 length:273 start_codon:yes stop_codon:yes gene_type:complete